MLALNCSHRRWMLRTWSRIGSNYVISLGFKPLSHSWGLSLYWGRRDLLGETVREGETRFADRIEWDAFYVTCK